MKTFYLLICLFILCQCNNKQSNLEQLTIKVSIKEDFQGISADSLFSSVTYIPLETSKASLLSNIDKINIYDSTLYILDKKQKIILAFDFNGKYKFKLDKQGRGVGEYLSLDDFFIADSSIYILVSNQQKISVYNLDFDFTFDFPIETHGTSIAYNNDSLFIFTNYCSTELQNFYIYNRYNGKFIDKFGNFPQKQLGVAYRQTTFAKYKNMLYSFLPYDYSIYKCNKNMERIYDINFGKNFMYPPNFNKYSDEEKTNYITRYSDPMQQPIGRIDNLFLCDKFLFFTFVKGIFPYNYFKWEKSHTVHVGGIVNSKQYPLANNNFIYIDNNIYVCVCQAETIFSFSKKESLFPTSLHKLKIDDNPVLSLHKFKIKL